MSLGNFQHKGASNILKIVQEYEIGTPNYLNQEEIALSVSFKWAPPLS